MSGRKSKKNQRLGSSRRGPKGLNRNIEKDDDDDDEGFQQIAESEDGRNEFHTTNDYHATQFDHPPSSSIDQQTSASECPPHARGHKDSLMETELPERKRKMGSTRKSTGRFKVERKLDDVRTTEELDEEYVTDVNTSTTEEQHTSLTEAERSSFPSDVSLQTKSSGLGKEPGTTLMFAVSENEEKDAVHRQEIRSDMPIDEAMGPSVHSVAFTAAESDLLREDSVMFDEPKTLSHQETPIASTSGLKRRMGSTRRPLGGKNRENVGVQEHSRNMTQNERKAEVIGEATLKMSEEMAQTWDDVARDDPSSHTESALVLKHFLLADRAELKEYDISGGTETTNQSVAFPLVDSEKPLTETSNHHGTPLLNKALDLKFSSHTEDLDVLNKVLKEAGSHLSDNSPHVPDTRKDTNASCNFRDVNTEAKEEVLKQKEEPQLEELVLHDQESSLNQHGIATLDNNYDCSLAQLIVGGSISFDMPVSNISHAEPTTTNLPHYMSDAVVEMQEIHKEIKQENNICNVASVTRDTLTDLESITEEDEDPHILTTRENENMSDERGSETKYAFEMTDQGDVRDHNVTQIIMDVRENEKDGETSRETICISHQKLCDVSAEKEELYKGQEHYSSNISLTHSLRQNDAGKMLENEEIRKDKKETENTAVNDVTSKSEEMFSFEDSATDTGSHTHQQLFMQSPDKEGYDLHDNVNEKDEKEGIIFSVESENAAFDRGNEISEGTEGVKEMDAAPVLTLDVGDADLHLEIEAQNKTFASTNSEPEGTEENIQDISVTLIRKVEVIGDTVTVESNMTTESDFLPDAQMEALEISKNVEKEVSGETDTIPEQSNISIIPVDSHREETHSTSSPVIQKRKIGSTRRPLKGNKGQRKKDHDEKEIFNLEDEPSPDESRYTAVSICVISESQTVTKIHAGSHENIGDVDIAPAEGDTESHSENKTFNSTTFEGEVVREVEVIGDTVTVESNMTTESVFHQTSPDANIDAFKVSENTDSEDSSDALRNSQSEIQLENKMNELTSGAERTEDSTCEASVSAREDEFIVDTVIVECNMTIESKLIQSDTLNDAKLEAVKASKNTESVSAVTDSVLLSQDDVTEGSRETGTFPEQSGINIIPEDSHGEEAHSKSSPFVHKRKMGSTRRPLRGNEGQRKEIEHHDETETLESYHMINKEKETISLENEPSPDESTLQSSRDGAKEQEMEICEKDDVGAVEGSESALLQSSCSSDLVSEESTAVSICHITESQTFTKTDEESQENTGDVESVPVEEDKDLQLEIDSQNKTFVLAASEAEATEKNIQDVSVMLIREVEVIGDKITVESNMTTESDFLPDAHMEALKVFKNAEKEISGETDTIIEQSDISIIPEDSHREETHSTSSPVIHKRKMGSTRRPLKGNKGRRKGHDEKEIFNLEDEPSPDESRYTAVSICDISESQTLTKIHAVSQENTGDVEIAPAEGDTESHSENKMFDSTAFEGEAEVREAEVIEHTATVESNMTTDPDFLQTSPDAHVEALKVSENSEKEVSGESDTIPEQSDINVIPEDSHREETHAKSSPVIHKRKMGSTRRPLKGNKGRKKDHDEKEIFSLEDNPIPDESRYTAVSICDISESQTLTKIHAGSQDNTGDVEIAPAEGDTESHSENKMFDSTAFEGEVEGREVEVIGNTVTVLCNMTTESDFHQTSPDSNMEALKVSENPDIEDSSDALKNSQSEIQPENKMIDLICGGEKTKDIICEAGDSVRKGEFIVDTVIMESNMTIESDLLQRDTLNDAKLEAVKASKNTESVSAVTDSVLLLQDDVTEGSRETDTFPEQSGINIIPEDSHGEEAHSKSSPFVHKRKMGSTHRPLRGNKGQRKEIEHHDETETLDSYRMINKEKETISLENEPSPDESTLQSLKDGAKEQEMEICEKDDVGAVEASESALLQSSCSSDLVSEESTAVSICHITESQTFTKTDEESQENTGDAERVPVEEDKDLQLKIDSQNKTFDLATIEAEGTEENIQDISVTLIREAEVIGDTVTVESNMTTDPDFLQTSPDAHMEALKVSENSEKEVSGESDTIPEQSDINVIPEDSHREETHAKSSPVIQKRKMGSTRRPLKGNKGRRKEIEHHNENETPECESMIIVEKEMFRLENEPSPDEYTLQISKDGAKEQEMEICEKYDVAPVEGSESALLQSSCSSDLVPEESTAVSICHITESQTLTKTDEESQVNPGDAERMAAEEDKDLQLEIDSQNKTFHLAASEAEGTEENIQDVSVMLIREVEVIGDTVTVESNMTTESDFLPDAHMEALKVFKNAEKEVSGETDTIIEQSDISIIPEDSHREETHSTSSPVTHKRKIGSTRRPLKGNKGRRKDLDEKEIFNLEDEPSPDESRYTAVSICDISESQTLTKIYAGSQENTGDVEIAPAEGDIESHSENKMFDSTAFEGEVEGREVEVIGDTVTVLCNMTTESDFHQTSPDANMEALKVSENPDIEDSSDVLKNSQSEIQPENKMIDLTCGGEKTKDTICEAGDSVRKDEFIIDTVIMESNMTIESDLLQRDTLNDAKLEAVKASKNTESVSAVTDSVLLLQDDVTEGSRETDTFPEQSGINIIPEDSHGEESHTKSSPFVHKRKMGSTRRPLRGNKGQRKEIEHHDETETLESYHMINAEKETISLENEPSPDESTLQSSRDGAKEQEMEICEKNDVGAVEGSESSLLQSSCSSDLVSEEFTAISICHITESQTFTKTDEESQENTGDVERVPVEEDKDLQLKIDSQNKTFNFATSEAEGTEENIQDISVALNREVEVIGDTVTVESNMTADPDFLQTSPDAHMEALKVSENSEKEVSGESDTIPEQSDINVIPEDSHREEKHSTSSPVIHKRKMGSTRRPLKGNKGRRKDHDEKEIFSLEDDPIPDESRYTAVSICDISESQTLTKIHAGSQENTGNVEIVPAEGDTESHSENKMFDSTVFEGEVEGREVEVIGDTVTLLFNMTTESDFHQTSPDANMEALKVSENPDIEDSSDALKNSQSEIQPENKMIDLTCGAEKTRDTICEAGDSVRKDEFIVDTVIMESNMTIESDLLQRDTLNDAKLEAVKASKNTESVSAVTDSVLLSQDDVTEGSRETDTFPEQSGINIIPEDSHGEEAHSKSSPFVHKRKMGSTRRPLRGNKGQRKEIEHHDETETLESYHMINAKKEIISLENEPSPDESTLQSSRDGAKEQEMEICEKNDVGAVEASESALLQSSCSSDLVSEESTAVSICHITESQTFTKTDEESQENTGDAERVPVEEDKDLQLKIDSQNKTFDLATIEAEGTEENIQDISVTLIREAEVIGDTVTVESNMTTDPDFLQTSPDAHMEALKVSENSEKEVSGESDTIPEQSDINVIPEDSHREETHAKSSPVIQKRKMGSTRRPLKGNKGRRKEIEHHNENETPECESMIIVEKEMFRLENEPSPDEYTLQISKDGAKEQEMEICEKYDVAPVEGSESALLQSSCSSDLVPEESTAVSICHITESQTLTKTDEESQVNPGDAERMAAEEDKDLQLEIDSQNKTFHLAASEAEGTEENIQDVSVMLIREVEVIGDTVTVESNMTTESDFLPDAHMEALKVFKNAEKEVSGETDTIIEQSDISIIPEDSHREETHSTSSPVTHKRKIGSTRRPLKGNKGRRKDLDEKEIFNLEDEPSPDESRYTAVSICDISESQTLTKIYAGSQENTGDVEIAPAEGDTESHSENKMFDSTAFEGEVEGREVEVIGDTVTVLCNMTTESDFHQTSPDANMEALKVSENPDIEDSSDVLKNSQSEIQPENKMIDLTCGGEKTKDTICEAGDSVRKGEFIIDTVIMESNMTIESDLLQRDTLNDAKLEAVKASKNTESVSAVTDSVLLLQDDVTEGSRETDTFPEQSGINIIPEDSHGEESHTKSSPFVHKRKMGSTRRPLRGNKGQRKEIEHHDETETLESYHMINAEKETISLENEPSPDESTLQSSRDGAKEQEMEICEKNDVGAVEGSESSLLQSSCSSDLVSEEFTAISICHITESQTFTKTDEESQENTGDVERVPVEEDKDLQLKIDSQNKTFNLATSEAEGTEENIQDISVALIREVEVIGDTVTVESNMTADPDFLQTSPDAHMEALKVSENSEKEVSGESDTIPEQSDINVIPEDTHREEKHSTSSPVIHKRKMGSTRRPLKGNKGRRKDHDEKEIFSLEDDPIPDESRYTAVSICDISESQTLTKIHAGSQENTGNVEIVPAEGDTESHSENKMFDSTVFEGEVEGREVEVIGDTVTLLFNMTTESDFHQTSPDANMEALKVSENPDIEDSSDALKNSQSEIQPENKMIDLTCGAEKTRDTICEAGDSVRKDEFIVDTVIMESNMTIESDLLQRDTLNDAKLEAVKASKNTESVSAVTDSVLLSQDDVTEGSRETDTFPEQSGINIIPEDSHGEEAHSKSSPFVHKRKMGSTCRPLRGNKGQRKEIEHHDETETLESYHMINAKKEIISLENEPSPDESTLQSSRDGAKEQEMEICEKNDVGAVEASESALLQSSCSSDLVSEESTAVSICHITESQTFTKTDEESQENTGDAERVPVEEDKDLQLKIDSQNKTFDLATIEAEGTEENIQDISVTLIREAEVIGDTVTVESNMTTDPDFLQTSPDAHMEALKVSENSEKEVSGESDTIPEQSDINVIPEDSHREETHAKSSPVIQKRKMGSTRRPLKGNKGRRKEIEHHNENETLECENMIIVEKEMFRLENEPSPDEYTLQISKDGAKVQEMEICEKYDVAPVEGSESALLQSSYSSDLVSEESTAVSIGHITESQTLAKTDEESQENPGDAERMAAEEDKDLQLEIDSQNKTFDLAASEAEGTEENIQDVTVMLIREVEVIGDTVTVESNMTAESDFLPDAHMEALKVFKNAEKEVSGEIDTIIEQSDISIIPEDSHREEKHSTSSPVIHKRKMGSARRPLKGNKGRRKDLDGKEIFNLEDEPSPDESRYTAVSICDISESQTLTKIHAVSQENTGDVEIVPAEGDTESHSENKMFDSTAFEGEAEVREAEFIGDTVTVLCNMTTESDFHQTSPDSNMEALKVSENPDIEDSSDALKNSQSEIQPENKMIDLTCGAEKTKDTICEAGDSVRKGEFIVDTVIMESNMTIESDLLQRDTLNDAKLEALKASKNTESVSAVTDSVLLLQDDVIEGSRETDTFPEQSGINIIPEDSHGEEAHSKSSPFVHKRKMGSTRRPLRGNKGQRKEIEHRDETETLESYHMINAEKETISLENEPSPDESTLQSSRDGAKEQEMEICEKNDVGAVEASESALLQSSCSSDLVSEESTAVSICHITESQTLTKTDEESQVKPGDAERIAAEEDKDLQLEIDSQTKTFDLAASEAEGTEENIQDISVMLIREAEVIGDTVTVESNMTTESDFPPDAHMEALKVFKNAEKEVSGETDTIIEQSDISIIPEDSHREETHSTSSPVIHKRKMGSTRRPLKGSKGRRKDLDEKEIFNLEDEPSPEESGYTAVNICDISESQTLTKIHAVSQENTGDVEIAPAEGDTESHSENKMFDSTAFEGEVEGREVEFIGHTVTVESNMTTESDFLQTSPDAHMEALKVSENAENEVSEEANTIPEQSDISIIPADSHREEKHSMSSPVVHKRKMGSTRRPLKGNKGQRKDLDEKEIFNLDDEPSPDESRYTAVSICDISESETLTKIHAVSQENTGDFKIAPAWEDTQSHSENKMFDPTAFEGETTEENICKASFLAKEVEFIGDAVIVESNMTTESDLIQNDTSSEAKLEALKVSDKAVHERLEETDVIPKQSDTTIIPEDTHGEEAYSKFTVTHKRKMGSTRRPLRGNKGQRNVRVESKENNGDRVSEEEDTETHSEIQNLDNVVDHNVTQEIQNIRDNEDGERMTTKTVDMSVQELCDDLELEQRSDVSQTQTGPSQTDTGSHLLEFSERTADFDSDVVVSSMSPQVDALLMEETQIHVSPNDVPPTEVVEMNPVSKKSIQKRKMGSTRKRGKRMVNEEEVEEEKKGEAENTTIDDETTKLEERLTLEEAITGSPVHQQLFSSSADKEGHDIQDIVCKSDVQTENSKQNDLNSTINPELLIESECSSNVAAEMVPDLPLRDVDTYLDPKQSVIPKESHREDQPNLNPVAQKRKMGSTRKMLRGNKGQGRDAESKKMDGDSEGMTQEQDTEPHLVTSARKTEFDEEVEQNFPAEYSHPVASSNMFPEPENGVKKVSLNIHDLSEVSEEKRMENTGNESNSLSEAINLNEGTKDKFVLTVSHEDVYQIVSEPEQTENTHKVIPTQELRATQDDDVHENNSRKIPATQEKRRKMGSTRRNPRAMHGKNMADNEDVLCVAEDRETKKTEEDLEEASSISQSKEVSSVSTTDLESEMLVSATDLKVGNDHLHSSGPTVPVTPENTLQICDTQLVNADVSKHPQSETVSIEKRRKMGSTRKNFRERRIQGKGDGAEDTETEATNLQMSQDSEMSLVREDGGQQTTHNSEDSLLSEIKRALNKTSQNSLSCNWELIIKEPNPDDLASATVLKTENSEIESLQPTPSAHSEPNSPGGRRRKMGSTRKNPRQQLKAEREDEDKEDGEIDESSKTNKQEKKDLERVEVSVVHNITENKLNKEYLDVSSAHTSSSQLEESTNPVSQERTSPSAKRKFGSRRANKGKQGVGRLAASDFGNELEDGDHKPDSSEVKDKLPSDDLAACDPCHTLQPENQPVSEQRNMEAKNEKAAPKGTGAGLVSLDQIIKHDRSTGAKQTVNLKNRISDTEVVQFNVVMVGNSCVGKTSFIRRFHEGQFTEDYCSTIGVDTFIQTIALPDKTVKLQIWDTAGQERFHSITTQVFHKADGLLLMYEITCSKSFISVRDWITQARERAPDDVIMMLLGNKNDSVKREVQIQEGADLAREYNIQFMECSAATGDNVSESMRSLAELLVQRKSQKEKHTTLRREPPQKKSGCC